MAIRKAKVEEDSASSASIVNDLRSNFQDASYFAKQRSMSKRRRNTNIIVLLLFLFLIFSLFFYFPALGSKSSTTKSAAQNGAVSTTAQTNAKKGKFSDRLLMNRGYLKAGQSVSTAYDLSPGTEITLVITKCAGPIIVEIYSCRGSEVSRVVIGKQPRGGLDLAVPENGFYLFSQHVTKTSTPGEKFKLNWTRR